MSIVFIWLLIGYLASGVVKYDYVKSFPNIDCPSWGPASVLMLTGPLNLLGVIGYLIYCHCAGVKVSLGWMNPFKNYKGKV